MNSLPLFIGLRYVRPRSQQFFVSFITAVSLLCVCVGVAALIIILSVMNGLEGELRERLLALSAHARVFVTPGASAPDWRALAAQVHAAPRVVGAAPFIEIEALAVRKPDMVPVRLRGIDPSLDGEVERLGTAMVEGHISDLEPGLDRVMVSRTLSAQLGLGISDSITLLVPTTDASGAPEPRLRDFHVAGVFEVRDWTQDHASYFRAVRIEKTMVAIILMLIVAVAAFYLVAMLAMVVTDKRGDIAILRTLGTSPRRVMAIFLVQGCVIAWFGVALGVLLGVIVGYNAGSIAAFLEHVFHFQFFSSDVYIVTRIPSELRAGQIAWIATISMLITLAATIYPALRAARIPPADALRYE
jgi:lipoprotein-releasing system permease protein